MSIRANYIVEDIQTCVYKMFTQLCSATSPWTDWQTVYGWPEASVFEEYTKPFIYIEPPVTVQDFYQFGGKSFQEWEMTIGAWDDRKTGGTEEINLMTSRIIELCNDPKAVNYTNTFTVTLGATTYTTTNLSTMGIGIEGVKSYRDINTTDIDLKEFRKEFIVAITA